MRESEFLNQLHLLLDTSVAGLDNSRKLDLVRNVVTETQRAVYQNRTLTCRIIPFTAGHRPIDEANYPGLGSSDNASLILPDGQRDENWVYILYKIGGLDDCTPGMLEEIEVDVTLSFSGTDGSLISSPLPGWDKRPIAPAVLAIDEDGSYLTELVPLDKANDRRLVLRLSPVNDFLPGPTWQWPELDEQLQALSTDGSDPFTFGHMFSQMLHVHLRITQRGVPLASADTWIDICDTRRFGSLYQRIVDKLVIPDTALQAEQAGLESLDHAYHPWFPVLLIGSDKAALYTRALVEDIVYKKRHLTDPRWLMRVGLYLEFLTCLGIIEAVKDEVDDLLTPAERTIFENDPSFATIRERLNPEGWQEVWHLRDIALPQFGVPATGPVSSSNLLQKRKAILGFLETHHDDLKHAIDLAGANTYSAQETWHRVYRDAERAVMRQTSLAFPELDHLSPQIKEFVLWHEQGKLGGNGGIRWMPKPFAAVFGDQDGLFASAGNQYRASMNEVAEWAKQQDLMDYTGDECVPSNVSLLQATMGQEQDRLKRLQRRDGYASDLRLDSESPEDMVIPAEEIYDLLGEVPIFELLSDEDRLQLARSVRMIHLGPMERIVIQGHDGSSLFLVGEGKLEALVRQDDGKDEIVDVKKRGEVFGEISLLTGAPRTATVRAAEGATVFEIGRRQYEPIIRANPQLVDELGTIMASHMANMRRHRDAYEADKEALNTTQRIRRFFFGNEDSGRNGSAT